MTDVAEPGAPIQVDGLNVIYQRGAQPAIDEVGFSLERGEGLLVAGDHGAGKSTLLRALLGLVRFGGLVRVLGAYPGTPAVATRVGYGPQGRGFAENMSPRQVVGLVAQLRSGRVEAAAVDQALSEAGVPAAVSDHRATDSELVRRVALAAAMVGQPDVVILDDPWEFPETITALTQIRERGGVVVAASHDPGGLGALLGRTLTLVQGVPA